MFSSTSSDCDCNDCHYARGLTSNIYDVPPPVGRPAPWCTSIGHPLVYYAQVQSPRNRRQRGKEKRNRPNCFVKAFKWYTQEHVPTQKEDSKDISNFATWLDAKYGEFLHCNADYVSRFKFPNISTLEVNTSNPECQPCAPKRYMLVKSPWAKRKRLTKQAGDLNDQTGPSFEIIMHPKDLACPASDCWRPSMALDTNGNKSTATLYSSDTQRSKKPASKSHSFTCSRKKNLDSTDVLIQRPKQDQKINAIDPKVHKTIEEQKELRKLTNSALQKTKEEEAKEENQFACQYPELKMQCTDAQMQYEVPKTVRTYSGYKTDQEIAMRQQVIRKQSRNDMKTFRVVEKHPKDVYSERHQNVKKYSNVSCQCSEENIQKNQYQFETGYSTSHDINQNNKQVLKKQSRTENMETFRVVEKQPKAVNSETRKYVKYSNVSCQCSEDNIQKYQYRFGTSYCTSHDMNQNNKQVFIRKQTRTDVRPLAVTVKHSDVSCVYNDETQSITSESGKLYRIDDRETCRDIRCCDIKTCVASEPRPYTALVSEVAQTSDHSLNLEKETVHGYPLFMKIVRADKN